MFPFIVMKDKKITCKPIKYKQKVSFWNLPYQTHPQRPMLKYRTYTLCLNFEAHEGVRVGYQVFFILINRWGRVNLRDRLIKCWGLCSKQLWSCRFFRIAQKQKYNSFCDTKESVGTDKGIQQILCDSPVLLLVRVYYLIISYLAIHYNWEQSFLK